MPADWAPTDAHRALARRHGLDIDLEGESFRGWAEGRTALSWNGTFTTRLANAAKWKRERDSVPAGLTQRPNGSPARLQPLPGVPVAVAMKGFQ